MEPMRHTELLTRLTRLKARGFYDDIVEDREGTSYVKFTGDPQTHILIEPRRFRMRVMSFATENQADEWVETQIESKRNL